MNLADFRTQVLAILGDTGAARYDNDYLDAAIREALSQYSAASPHIKTGEITIASTARDQVLSSLSGSAVGLTHILQVHYPKIGRAHV